MAALSRGASRRGLAFWVACGLGSGLAPVAPGTVGSAGALMVGIGMLALAPWVVPVAAVVATLGGWWAVRRCAALLGDGGDPGWVVVDEVAGQWIALLPVAVAALWAAPGAVLNPLALGLAFLAFRAFDIVKPGPVGWADRRDGAAAVMGDDVVAGALAACLVAAAQVLLPGWFAVPASALWGS